MMATLAWPAGAFASVVLLVHEVWLRLAETRNPVQFFGS
jgi:hypothetical protein